MFETSGILNEETLKEINDYWIPHKSKNAVKVFIFMFAILSVISFNVIKALFIFCIIGFLLFTALYVYSKNIFYRKNYSSLKEWSDNGEAKYKIAFNDSGALVHNFNTEGKVLIKYESFERLEDTPNMFLLVTKSGQYVTVYKNCLNSEQLREFKIFINDKCENLKR